MVRRRVGMMDGRMKVRVCVVIGLAFGRVAEDGVGFRDLDETLGRTWVIGVAVWMVGFGEFVERPLRG